MKLKAVSRIILTLVSIIAVILIALVVGLFTLLPSPTDIRKQFVSQPHSQHSTQDKSQTPQNSIKSDPAIKQPLLAYPIELNKSADKIEDANKQTLENLMDDTKPLSTVCKALGKSTPKQNEMVSSKEFSERLKTSLLDEPQDPLLESLKPVLKFSLTQPAMKELLKQLTDAETNKTNSSLVEKTQFYGKAYTAFQEMSANQSQMEEILDQSYLLMMLGKATDLNPNLVNDPHVMAYCETIEAQLNNKENMNYDQAKIAFADFLDQVQIKPEQIGFDTNYKTKLNIQLNKQGLQFSGGWIDNVLAPDQVVEQKSTHE